MSRLFDLFIQGFAALIGNSMHPVRDERAGRSQSTFAALRTDQIGRQLGARPLSSPAEFVVAEEQYDGAMRFSRTLDERNPHCRSSQVEIVPMSEPRTPLHQKVLYVVALLGIVTAITFNNFGA